MASENRSTHAITLESAPSTSGEASAWARELAERAGLSEERTYALDLCVVEMVTNVVNHAYRGGPGEITLELAVAAEGAVLAIGDRGPAFDPLSIAPRATPASLDEASIGGYGIHMVRSTADGCRYERRDNRNVFTAWFGAPPRP
jgi:anti-sigma regulatory factor (Ser/Thr protein kinase)